MISDRLRKAVLQAAMEGKLTKQLDKDNSYNHSGINGNKQITYEEIDKTGLVVPTTWRFYKLVDVSDVIGGYAFKSSKYLKGNIENGVRVIRISDFNNDGLIDNSPVYYDEDNKLSRYEIRDNDILLCMTGGTVGKNTLVNIIDKKLYLNQRVAAIRNNSPSLLNTEYLHIVLNTPYIQKIINDSKNSTNDNISMRQINNFIIPIPPLKEQKRIVEKLEVLLAEIDKLEQDEKELKELEDKFPKRLKSAILQAAIQGEIINQSIDKDNSCNSSVINGIYGNNQITQEEIDQTGLVIPTTWTFYKLVDVSEVIGGYAFKNSEYLKSNIENGVRVVRISDFNNDGLIDNSPVYYDEDNKLSRYEIRENDILLCMTGGTVGKNTLVNNIDKKLYLNQRVAAIRNNSPSLLNTEYLHIVLNTPYIQKIINDSKNSTNDNISMRQINNFIIPIPPLKEQIEIINKIKKLSINIETM